MSSQRAFLPFLALIAMGATLTACAPESEGARPAESYIGGTVAAGVDSSPESDSVSSYDLSEDLLDKAPTMTATVGESENFEVVAACYEDGTLHLGAIPLTDVTNDIRERARAGEYEDLVPACE